MIATELYGDARLSRDETLARFCEHARGEVTVYEPNDWRAPYASGSAKVDAYLICPCSMGTLGTIASGAMSNLIHRAASVALKEERKLVLMPRETPLSTIHLQNMLTLRQAGATILFLAPGFYHGAETVDDLVDFVAGRALDLLGLENALVKQVGRDERRERGALPANEVRSMFDRIAPVYDVMNRVMTVGLDLRWRRIAAEAVVRPGDRVLDACCGTGDLAVACAQRGGIVTGLDFSPRMLERARRKLPSATWVEGDLLALPFEDGSFEAATVGFGVRNVADLERRLARAPPRARAGRARRRARDHPAARPARALLPGLVRPDRADARQRLLKGGEAYYVPARERPPVPRPGRARRADAAPRASPTSSTAPSPAGSSRCTSGASA